MIESFRDESREAEMLAKVMQWLPYPDIERDCLCCGGEEETIYRMTAQGTDALPRSGGSPLYRSVQKPPGSAQSESVCRRLGIVRSSKS